MPNDKRYVGVSVDPQKRFKAHARKPPPRMVADAMQHQPFEQHFRLTVVESFSSRFAAELCERRLIEQHASAGAKGYNQLPSAPGKSQHFWVQHRRGNM